MRITITTIICACLIMTAGAAFAQDAENVEQVGRIQTSWGRASSVAVTGDFAYVATGMTGLQVVDISDKANPVVVRSLDKFENAERVAISGDYVYVYCDGGGLYVFSISEPANPDEVGYLQLEIQFVYCIYISDETLFLGSGNGLDIISLADPVNPVEIRYFETNYCVGSIAVSNGYAWIADQQSLHVVSVADPENIEEVGLGLENLLIRGVRISGDYAYISSAVHFYIVPIADPENPSIVGTCPRIHGEVDGIAVSGGYAYVVGRFGNHLKIISIADPQNPVQVGNCDIPNYDYATGIAISDGYALITNHYNGLRVISVEDPENPEQVGIYNERFRADNITVSGDYAFLWGEGTRLALFSIEDPENPREVERYNVPDGWISCVCSYGDYVYYTLGFDGLKILARNDADSLEEVATFRIDDVAFGQIAVANNLACISGTVSEDGQSLFIVSISDPENPEVVGRLDNLSDGITDISISGDNVYLSMFSQVDIGGGFRIVTIADPEQPREVVRLGWPWGGHIAVSDDYVFLVSGGLFVISVADLGNPEILSFRELPGEHVTDISIAGDFAYISNFDSGLRVWDVSNPDSPEEVGYFDTYGHANGVALLENGLICVADYTNLGIYHFTAPDGVNDPASSVPLDFSLSPTFPNPFNSTTTITYGMPVGSSVSLGLYDLYGRKVITMVEGFQHAGIHQSIINAAELPSGLYFIRLEAGNQEIMQKITLIR